MAAKSNLINMALCLSAVCLVCSALLAFTNELTAEPIAAAAKAKTNASIAKVLPNFDSEPVQGAVQLNGVNYPYFQVEGVGAAVLSTVSGFGGPLTVMVGVLENGVISNTVVLSHSETPGLGAKCQTDEGFISQFMTLDPQATKLAVKKDGGDIDAITASTITSRAYTLAVANALAAYAEISKIGGQENE